MGSGGRTDLASDWASAARDGCRRGLVAGEPEGLAPSRALLEDSGSE